MRLTSLIATWRRLVVAIALVATCGAGAFAAQTAAIASAHPLATAAGKSVLERGGNAFDAAIAVAAALAVVEPYSSGLGGGGFFLLHRAADGRQVMIDARETAPRGVTRSQYFDAEGQPRPDATTRGGTAAAIPGTPAAFVHLAMHYGRLPLAVSLQPAVRLAREGFAVDSRYAQIAKLREKFLQTGTDTGIFLDSSGRAPAPGYLLKQPDLALTLESIGRYGLAGFYQGPVARAMIDAVNRTGGRWSEADLGGYVVQEREPTRFTYRGARITAAALPSAGGIAVEQSLRMLESFPLDRIGDPATDHLVVEALRRAFQDRERYLGDPDFVRVPAGLVSADYAAARAASIDPNHVTSSAALGDMAADLRPRSENTTHFSIVDDAGNRVAATVTINLLFGSGVVAPGTGVLLNNEMDDFTLRSDVPNAFMLRGGAANRIEPRKRPLSSMTPMFVEDGKGVLIVGAPGGSRIISQVLLATLEYLRSAEVDLTRIVSIPRYHHQFWPDRLEIEPEGFSPEWREAMAAKGHEIAVSRRRWGNMQAVFKARNGGEARAASDPRGEGLAWY